MSDVATLGIRIDSSDATRATAALSGLAAAAIPATNATAALTTAAKAGAAAHAGMSTQAMSAFHSVRSMAEGFALGMPPTQILTQQMNHLSYAASGPSGLTGAFKEVGRSLLGALSPTMLVAGGFAAVGAAGYFAYSHIRASALAFDDASRAIGITSGELQALQASAQHSGIAEPDFIKGMERLGTSVYDAKNGMGGLAELMRANGLNAQTFTGYLEKASELIKNASGDTQKQFAVLTQMGLPATMEWVRWLSQGADGIKAAVAHAGEFGSVAEEAMVAKARKFDEEWSKTWTNFSHGAKSAFLGALDGLNSFGDTVTRWLMKLPGIGGNVARNMLSDAMSGGPTAGNTLTNSSDVSSFYKGTGAGLGNAKQPAATIDPNVLKDKIAKEQQSIGILGQLATAEDAVRQVELQVQSARLNGVSIDQAKVDQLKALARENALGITQTKAQADAYNVEAATVGMAIGQAAELAAVQNKINEAKRLGITLSPQELADIRTNAAAMGQAAQTVDNMRTSYEGLVRGPMQSFMSAIQQGSTAMDALKKAGQSALNAIATKLTDMAAQNLWSSAFGGSSGGGLMSLLGLGGGVNADGSITGAVGATSVGGAPLVAAGFHSGGGPGDAPTFMRSIHPAYFDDAPRFHSGIGPDEQAAIIRKDESVLTPGQMGQLSKTGGPQHVTVGVTVDDDGKLQAYVKNVSQQSAADGVNSFVGSPAFIDHVARGYQMARTQRKVG